MPAAFPSVPGLRSLSARAARRLKRLAQGSLLLAAAGLPMAAQAKAPAAPWPVKVVIVTTFENGADTGDKPGELQLWAEREHLTQKISFPGGVHPILTNADHSVIAIMTGMSLVNAGVSVMALGTDPRFDLRKSYWLVAGIAGVDPEVASVGSAAWARYVVNDVAQSIDMREAPEGWPYGVYANGAKAPNTLEGAGNDFGPMAPYPMVFPLNAGLAQWAWRTSRDTPLMNAPEMEAFSKGWSAYTGARQKPQVIMGDSFASDLYWHGSYLNQYARDWVKMFAGKGGRFAMSNMEDSAIASAMTRLDHMHRADFQRLMVLRTASNYTLPAKSESTLHSVTSAYPLDGLPAYDAAWRVGSKVLHELTGKWSVYGKQVPTAQP
jgi:purine nucleoside permease